MRFGIVIFRLWTIVIVLFTFCSFTSTETEYRLEVNEILEKVNNLRSNGCYCGGKYMTPVHPLKWDKTLYRSALAHAKDMSNYDYFSHHSRKGEDIGMRLDKYGYTWQVAGENLGEGQRSFTEVLHDWKESKSHCKMLMNPKVEDMAVARYGKYWVQHFGKKIRTSRSAPTSNK